MINYIQNAIYHFKIRNQISHAIVEALKHRSSKALVEVAELADKHAEELLNTLLGWINYSKPDMAYAALLLLDHLVSCCNYNFHVALAQSKVLQDKIVYLAIRGAEDEAHRLVQRLCRLTLLEYSRTFAHDEELKCLSMLIGTFEQSTGKNLMRCLNIQKRKVKFKEVDEKDVILINPSADISASVGGSSLGVKDLAPLKFSVAEVWPCPVCGYMNSPASTQCAACEILRHVKTPLGSSSSSTTENEEHTSQKE